MPATRRIQAVAAASVAGGRRVDRLELRAASATPYVPVAFRTTAASPSRATPTMVIVPISEGRPLASVDAARNDAPTAARGWAIALCSGRSEDGIETAAATGNNGSMRSITARNTFGVRRIRTG